MRRKAVIGAVLLLGSVVVLAGLPLVQYVAPACRDATSQVEAAHAATMAARRRNAGDVPALYLDEATFRGYRTARCGPLARLFDVPAD